jgi:hypothetical protein
MQSTVYRHHSQRIATHIATQVDTGLDAFGSSAAWMGTVDPATGAYPSPYARNSIPPRLYRHMHAPEGYNFYYHQPDLVAALNLDNPPTSAVNGYVDHFLANCVLTNGLFAWGAHYYWDAIAGALKWIRGNAAMWPDSSPAPLAVTKSDNGNYHEFRPHCPAWGVIASRNLAVVETEITTMLSRHLINSSTGEFNRHAFDQGAGTNLAFLEWLGPAIETAVWLYEQTEDTDLLATCQKMIDYAYGARNSTTGLLANCRNSPANRWDRYVATTEIAVLAHSLMLCAPRVPSQYADDWRNKAAAIVMPWVASGWDEDAGKYYGQLDVATGLPVFGVYPGTTNTIFLPHDHADPWIDFFPSHDYPYHMAEACLDLWLDTGDPAYRTGVRRWAGQFMRSLPGRGHARNFAEHYARMIWFFCRGADAGFHGYRQAAWRVAEEAYQQHWTGAMYRSSDAPGWNEHVDGVGFLALAMMYLHRGSQPDLMGMSF